MHVVRRHLFYDVDSVGEKTPDFALSIRGNQIFI